MQSVSAWPFKQIDSKRNRNTPAPTPTKTRRVAREKRDLKKILPANGRKPDRVIPAHDYWHRAGG